MMVSPGLACIDFRVRRRGRRFIKSQNATLAPITANAPTPAAAAMIVVELLLCCAPPVAVVGDAAFVFCALLGLEEIILAELTPDELETLDVELALLELETLDVELALVVLEVTATLKDAIEVADDELVMTLDVLLWAAATEEELMPTLELAATDDAVGAAEELEGIAEEVDVIKMAEEVATAEEVVIVDEETGQDAVKLIGVMGAASHGAELAYVAPRWLTCKSLRVGSKARPHTWLSKFVLP